MHPFCYKSINATSTVKYRSDTDFKFRYCLSAFCVLKSAWHLCSNNHNAVLYKWLFIVRTLQFSIYYCITCVPSDTEPPGPSTGLLDWETVHQKLPWSVILVIGGGFALAEACKASVNVRDIIHWFIVQHTFVPKIMERSLNLWNTWIYCRRDWFVTEQVLYIIFAPKLFIEFTHHLKLSIIIHFIIWCYCHFFCGELPNFNGPLMYDLIC